MCDLRVMLTEKLAARGKRVCKPLHLLIQGLQVNIKPTPFIWNLQRINRIRIKIVQAEIKHYTAKGD